MCKSHLLILHSSFQPLFSDPILIRRSGSRTFCCCNEAENLFPNGRLGIIAWMNTYPQQRFGIQQTEQRCVPTTKRAAPIIVNTVNERSRRKRGFRAEIAHRAQACRVFQFRIANGLLCFVSQQPRWSDKTARFEPERTEFISCRGDAAQSFLITQIVKLAFVLGIKPGLRIYRAKFPFSEAGGRENSRESRLCARRLPEPEAMSQIRGAWRRVPHGDNPAPQEPNKRARHGRSILK